MNHIVLGALIPFVPWVVIYLARGMRTSPIQLLLAPVLMGACAFWAAAPDLPRVLGWMELYRKLDRDPRCNLCFWHHSIDKMEMESPVYAVLLVAMILSLLVAAWLELRRTEQG
ncbi:MAG: hypothetical protein WCL44_12325 [bacterium]